MSPKIHHSFWSDETIEGLDAESKLVMLWLITNPQTNLLGICSVSKRRFHLDTSLPEEALGRAIQALGQAVFRSGSTIFLRNFIRHQFGVGAQLKTNNIFKAIRSQFQSVKDENIRAEIMLEYPELVPPNAPTCPTPEEKEEGLTNPFKGVRKGIGIRTGEGTREEKGGAGGIAPSTEQWTTSHTKARIVLYHLNEKAGTKFVEAAANLDPIAERLFETQLDVDGCLKMINRLVKLWKHDPKMSSHLRPTTLFGEKFHGYYGQRDAEIPNGKVPQSSREFEEPPSKVKNL